MDWAETSKLLIGAAIGFGTSQFTDFINERRKRRQKIIEDYKRSLYVAEVSLNTSLIMMYKNVELLAESAAMSAKGHWMSTLPVKLDFDKGLAYDLHNQDLINNWIHLSLQIEMMNQLMDNFQDYYSRTSNEIHTMALHGDTGQNNEITNSTILRDMETLEGFAKSLHDMSEGIIDNALQMYADIFVHAERRNKLRTRIRSPKKLGKFKVPTKERKSALRQLRKKFEDNHKFTRYGSNLPSAD